MPAETEKSPPSSWKNQVLSAFIGLAGAFGGSTGAYKLMEYRLDLAEEKIASLEVAVETTGEEVKCMICKAHDMGCPGCDQ